MTDLETRIVCHHVGGRGFGVSLNAPPQFWQDMVHVLYEADADNVQEMLGDEAHPQRQLLGTNFHITPYCLGESVGKGRLHLTANAFASSLLRPDPCFFQYYCEVPVAPSVRDVTYHDMLEVVDEVDLQVYSLDYLFEQGKQPFPALPDFLSIDTQGAELSIMRGGRRTIARNVLGMVSEVEIKAMYAGQPLLSDILKYADEIGFHFAGFTYLQEVSSFRAPIGFRGRGFPAFGDALFLRKLSDLRGMAQSTDEHRLMLHKLAFIAINFGHVEYGLHALSEAERISWTGDAPSRIAERKYAAFLDEVMRYYRAAQPLYPRFIGIADESMPAVERKRRASRRKEVAPPIGTRPADPSPSSHAPSPAVPAAQPICKTSALSELHSKMIKRSKLDSRRIRQLVLRDPQTAIAKLLVYGLAQVASPEPARMEPAAEPTTPLPTPEPPQWPFEGLLASYGFEGTVATVRARRAASEAPVRQEGPASSDGPDFGPTPASTRR